MGSTITVPFHGTDLLAITTDHGPPLVPLPPLCEGMGIGWPSQLKRVKRDLILGPSMVMMTMLSGQTAQCLPLDLVPGFLFKVDARRVAEAVRPKVLDYQRECFRVLADACLDPATPRAPLAAASPEPQPIAALPIGEARRLVTEARHTFGVPQARDLWFALVLPRTASMIAPPTIDLFANAARRPGGQA